MFKLKSTRGFRKFRVKACGNCRYLQGLDYGMTLTCARPIRATKDGSPFWVHNSSNYAEDVFREVWTHVCDRWVKKRS